MYVDLRLCVFGRGREWLWDSGGPVGAHVGQYGARGGGECRHGLALQYLCDGVGRRRDPHLVRIRVVGRPPDGTSFDGRGFTDRVTKVGRHLGSHWYDRDTLHFAHISSEESGPAELVVHTLVTTGDDRSCGGIGPGQLRIPVPRGWSRRMHVECGAHSLSRRSQRFARR